MQNRPISFLVAPAVVVLLLAVALAAGVPWNAPSGGASGVTFAPAFSVAVADTTPEATSDITFQLDLPSGDVNFAAVVGFFPADWGIGDGREVPLGADVALVEAQITLGLINAACQTQLPIVFEMKNASLDEGDTVSFDDNNGNGTNDFAEDSDDNHIFDGIDHWPDFIS